MTPPFCTTFAVIARIMPRGDVRLPASGKNTPPAKLGAPGERKHFGDGDDAGVPKRCAFTRIPWVEHLHAVAEPLQVNRTTETDHAGADNSNAPAFGKYRRRKCRR